MGPTWRAVITVGALAVLLPAATAAQDAPQAPQATLQDLAFMAGCWRGGFGNGGVLEEFYSSPSDNLIVGTSRFLRDGGAVQFEFSRITRDSTGIALLPFPGGRVSEHAFRLTSIAPGTATFEAPDHDFPKRIRYAAGDEDSLIARIDGGEGDERVQEWRMQRAPCPGG